MEVITYHEAKAAGLPRYFTGIPCRHGHIAERTTAERKCVFCKRAKDRRRQPRPSGRPSPEAVAQWLREHPDYHSEWRSKHPGYQREHRRANAAAYRDRDKRYREKNPDAIRNWLRANPGKISEYSGARRARKMGAAGRHTKTEIADLLVRQRGRCAICRQRFTKTRPSTEDHIIALSRGGGNGINNIQLVHRECNSTKGAKDPIEFAQSRGLLL